MEIEKMLELARRVYPECRWELDKNFAAVYSYEYDDGKVVIMFDPSLSGTPEQKAQALAVLKKLRAVSPKNGPDSMFAAYAIYDALISCDLTAASLAILESK